MLSCAPNIVQVKFFPFCVPISRYLGSHFFAQDLVRENQRPFTEFPVSVLRSIRNVWPKAAVEN